MSYLHQSGGFRLHELSRGDRKTQVGSTKHFTGGIVLGDDYGVRLGTESHFETNATLLLAYAPIVHCLNVHTAPMQTEFPRAMRRLRGAGARKIVMVAADGGLEARTSEYRNIAETYGFECSFRTWNDLLASTRWPE